MQAPAYRSCLWILFIGFIGNQNLFSQELLTVAHRADVSLTHQQNLYVVSAYGEPITGITHQQDVFVISGFYPFMWLSGGLINSVPEVSQLPEIHVYPSLVQAHVYIQNTGLESYDLQLRLLAIGGLEIQYKESTILQKDKLQIPLTALISGTYYLEIRDRKTNKRQVFTLIKQ